jgi:hypothetical protein
MEATRPVPYYRHNQVPPLRRKTRPPEFRGLGDFVAKGVALIDSNRLVELVATDGIGMILPRTALALKMRGIDDGRETFLREMSGLVGNMFLVGWASQLMVGMLGNSVNPYNPLGIPGKAWVSSENLDAFGKLYNEALDKAGSPQQAREAFIKSVLDGLESGDKQFSIESRLVNLRKLPQEAQETTLRQMVDTIGDGANFESYKALLKQPEQLPQLKEKFLQNGWGRLSRQNQDELYQYFIQARDMKDGIRGTHNFDARAAKRVGELLEDTADPKALKQAFLKNRLAFSLDDLRNEATQFQNAIDHDALAKGLTGTINLRDKTGKSFLSHNQSRGSFLKELKFYLEQYVDRAAYAAEKSKAQAPWKDQIRARLFGIGKKDLLSKIIPRAEDGLITAARKSKLAYTWIPMLFAVMAGGAFTFYNNYLTMKKHGGKVFFPGEGGPSSDPVPAASNPIPFSGTVFPGAFRTPPAFAPFKNLATGPSPNLRQPFIQAHSTQTPNNQSHNLQGGLQA